MNVKEAKKMLEITPEEISSLQKYQGYGHTVINTLCNLNPEAYKQLEKSGWDMLKGNKEIESEINNFVNIYSAMYKNSYGKNNGINLIRGTGREDVNRISKTTDSFLSTTTSEEIAKTFSHYRDDALIRINLEKDVPYIDMTPYVNENSRDESEILVAPFCKVKKKELMSQYQGYNYYRLELSKPELQEKSSDELEIMHEKIINGFEENLKHMKDYLDYRDKVEYCDIHFKSASGDREYQNEIIEQKAEFYRKMQEEYHFVYEFKQDVRVLLEGLCRQKEIEIEKAHQIIKEDEEKRNAETKKQTEIQIRKDSIQRLEDNVQSAINGSGQLTGNLDDFYHKLSSNSYTIQTISNQLFVTYNYNQSIITIKEEIDKIKSTVTVVNPRVQEEKNIEEKNTVKEIDEKASNVFEYISRINQSNDIATNLNELSNILGKEIELEMKQKIMDRAQDIIKAAKISQYTTQLNSLESQKVGFFGMLFGKEKLRQEQIKNIELRIQSEQLEEKLTPEETNNYSIRNTLSELYAAANHEIGEEYNKEIISYYNIIKNTFGTNGNQFSDEEIAHIAYQKISQNENNLPASIEQKQGTRNQIQWLKSENERLQNENYIKQQNSKINFRENIQAKNNTTNQMLQQLELINSTLKNNIYYEKIEEIEQGKNRDNFKQKNEDTMELKI